MTMTTIAARFLGRGRSMVLACAVRQEKSVKGFTDVGRTCGVSQGTRFSSFRSFCSASMPESGAPSSVVVEKLGDVVTIGINRPEKRNCVDLETGRSLRRAFEDFENDDEALVAVLHGIGGSFSAGFDLKALSESEPDDAGMTKDWEEALNDASNGIMGPTRMMLKKPVIGAITGYAVAGGMELALMCDLRVMEENAIMGIYCRRFGVPLIDGGTVRLPAIIGLGRALDLILTGRGIGAKEAFEIGLVNRVVSTGTGLGQAVNLARSITKFPMECLKADRANTYSAVFGSGREREASLAQKLADELANAKHVIHQEAITGAKRFAQDGIGRHGKFALDTRETVEKRRRNLESLTMDS